MDETQYATGFTEEQIEQFERERKFPETKKYYDEQFYFWSMLKLYVLTEHKNQLKKWGIQEHTLPEWVMITTEELGELAKAVSEFVYRNGSSEKIFNEAIQVATLALKIAEMVEMQTTQEEKRR